MNYETAMAARKATEHVYTLACLDVAGDMELIELARASLFEGYHIELNADEIKLLCLIAMDKLDVLHERIKRREGLRKEWLNACECVRRLS
jgi:hypothetical protein